MNTKDLANPSDLKGFLQDTPFAFNELQPLSGGTANFVCRLELASPYEGRPSLVLKHAKPYVLSSGTRIPFALERQKFEVEAIKYVKELLPPDSFVSVPEIHLFDENENIIIMDDCGASSVTLKQFILDHRCTPELAEKIGSGLGDFLYRLHSTNSGNVRGLFATNEQGKQISAWATYGRLVSTVNGEDSLPALSDPPLQLDKAYLHLLSEVAAETSAAIVSAEDTFVMGDFWPGNILVSVHPETGDEWDQCG